MCSYQGKDGSIVKLPEGTYKRGRPFPFKNGSQLTAKGYIRITAGPWRGQYLHRIVAAMKWREKYSEPMPKHLHVHHMDFRKAHDCPENLLIMDSGIHLSCNGFNNRRH